MQIEVTWFDGVRQCVEVDDEWAEPQLRVHRHPKVQRTTLVRVGRLEDGTPRYVEDTSGHSGSPPLWSYLQ